MTTRSEAQRHFLAECAAVAVVAVCWLASLVFGLGGAMASQAISNFGLIAAAGSAEWPAWSGPVAAAAGTGACGS